MAKILENSTLWPGTVARFEVRSESGSTIRGHWLNGPLAGREACVDRAAFQGRLQESLSRPPRKTRRAEAQARAEALLALLREQGGLQVGPAAVQLGYTEQEIRSAIGALRRQGHVVEALGNGCFGLKVEA